MKRHTYIGFTLIVLLNYSILAVAQAQESNETSDQKNALQSADTNKLQYMHGRLSYRKKIPEGFERGREDWWLTYNRDGSRTMRTLAMTDDSKFVRDVIYTIDKNGRPLRIYDQIQVDNRLVGSGYFQVTGDTMTVVTDGIETGHTVQEIPVPERFHVMTHAVMLDGWPAWAYQGDKLGTQTISTYSTSPTWNGTTGPLGYMIEQHPAFLGSEEITVPAGTFQTRHYSWGDPDPDRALHVWVTGEHNILIQYNTPASAMVYVLESLTVEPQTD